MSTLLMFLLLQAAAAIQVSTKNGRIKGEYIRNQLGSGYYVFRGILYAKPSTTNFSSPDPEPIGKWDGVRDATIGWKRPLESTNKTKGSEDCLHLTIYTRKIRRWLPTTMVRTYQSSPVDVHFIGCTIKSGGNEIKTETDNILEKDVVKVLVHLWMGNSSSAGDRSERTVEEQLLALEWIKGNILYFGGDPQRVAVFQGHSALADIDINRLSLRSSRT